MDCASEVSWVSEIQVRQTLGSPADNVHLQQRFSIAGWGTYQMTINGNKVSRLVYCFLGAVTTLLFRLIQLMIQAMLINSGALFERSERR